MYMSHVKSGTFTDEWGRNWLYSTDGKGKPKQRIGGPFDSPQEGDRISMQISRDLGEAPISEYSKAVEDYLRRKANAILGTRQLGDLEFEWDVVHGMGTPGAPVPPDELLKMGFDPSAGVFLDSGLRDDLSFALQGFRPNSPQIGLKFVSDKGPQMVSYLTGRSEQEMYDYLNKKNALRPGVDSFNQWKSLGSKVPQNDFVAAFDYAIDEAHPEYLLDTWRHEYRHRGLDDPRLLQRLPTNFQKKLGDREEALVRMYDQHFGGEEAKRDAEKYFERYQNPYLAQQSLGSMLDEIEDAAGAINKRDTLPKDWFTALFD
jgi:hypothetical protein